MSDNQGQPPMAPPPPPAGYQPPAAPPVPPAQPAPGYAPPVPPGYAPAPGYAPPPAPKKSNTVLWIVIAVLVVALIGGGIAAFMLLGDDDEGGSGGKKLSAEEKAEAEIEDALDTINEAGVEGDADVLEDYVDVESIAAAAFDDFMDYLMGTPDFQDLIAEVGEEEALALIEENFPREDMIAQFEDDFSFEDADSEPFPDYTIEDIELDDDQAEVTIASYDPDDEETELEWVLAMEKRDDIWVITEFVNLIDMLAEQGEL